MILNLGSGGNIIDSAMNVDFVDGEGTDYVADLTKFPWIWEDNSVNGIYLHHVLEHFPLDMQQNIIRECHRILKVGAFFEIGVPHSSSIGGIGCWGHYSVYNLNSFSSYLSNPDRAAQYLFPGIRFKTISEKINWLHLRSVGKYKSSSKGLVYRIAYLMNIFMSGLINICPKLYERFLWVYSGGASEVVWKGIKL